MITTPMHEVSSALDLVTIRRLAHQVRAQLETQRMEIVNEIRHYPPPIPACDQQFNHLLEQRSKVAQELQQIDALLKVAIGPQAACHALRDFIRTSAFMDRQAAAALLANPAFNAQPATTTTQ